MSRTLLVLSPRLGAVLPAAALPALRAADRVLADDSVPAELVGAAGAEPLAGPSAADPADPANPSDPANPADPPDLPAWPAGSCVLLTAYADHPWAAGADAVLRVPEPTGAALLDAVAVMDRLRSPGGCPWDAEQTHVSLLKYLVEECYELYQAVEDADRPALREELGDVLLQVLFHARLTVEGAVPPFDAAPAGEPFGIDDVAADLVRKLVDRHPHVFATDPGPADRVRTASDQEVRWDELKRVEKRRDSSVDGVALSQPAAALTAKLVSRARKAGVPADVLGAGNGTRGELFARVAEITWAGGDPEHELRGSALRFAEQVRSAEAAAREAGLDPHALTETEWRRFWPASMES